MEKTNTVLPPAPSLFVNVCFQQEGRPSKIFNIDIIKSLDLALDFVCKEWNIVTPEKFVLKVLAEPGNKQSYILTEENKFKLKPGSVISIIESPFKMLDEIISQSKTEKDDNQVYLVDHAAKYSNDLSFSKNLVEKGGFEIIRDTILNPNNVGNHSLISNCLYSMSNLLSFKLITDVSYIPDNFCDYIINLKNSQNISHDAIALVYNVIASLLNSFPILFNNIVSTLTPSIMLEDLKINNLNLIFSILNYFFIIFCQTPNSDKIALRNLLYKSEMRDRMQQLFITCSAQMSPEMLSKINLLEYIALYPTTLLFSSKIDESNEKEFLDRLEVIYNKVYPNDDEPNYYRFGSQLRNDPIIYFKRFPGRVAFNCFEYFSNKYYETFLDLLKTSYSDVEDGPNGWSMLSVTMGISKELINYFKLHTSIDGDYKLDIHHPLIFSVISPFEELFCVLVVLFGKTWTEMAPKEREFSKCLNVCKEQLKLALKEVPFSIEDLRKKLYKLDYNSIKNKITLENTDGMLSNESLPSLIQLKDILRPKLKKTILKQRINALLEGAFFTNNKIKKNKFFGALSEKDHSLYFCEKLELVNDKMQRKHEFLTVHISDIAEVQTICGVKDSNKGKKASNHGFIIVMKKTENNLELFTETQENADIFVDGLCALMKNELNSERFNEDFKKLMDISLQITLLDLENANIPQIVPPVPKAPTNMDFSLPKY